MKTEFDIIIAGKDLNDLLDKFKLINHTHYLLFKNTNQRKSLERLVINFGFDKISKAVEMVAQTNGMPYAPNITTPYELEAKWDKWINFVRSERAKQNTKGKKILGL